MRNTRFEKRVLSAIPLSTFNSPLSTYHQPLPPPPPKLPPPKPPKPPPPPPNPPPPPENPPNPPPPPLPRPSWEPSNNHQNGLALPRPPITWLPPPPPPPRLIAARIRTIKMTINGTNEL